MIPEDTIAAVSTPPGEGGVSIIRISGPQSLSIADRICPAARAASSRDRNTFFLTRAVDAEGNVLDEVIVLIYRAPHSYTREDVVEIQAHGGPVCARRLLRAAMAAGARPADPGEFTKRAFLNGRIDLAQAEAVADLVHAATDRAAAAAYEQLSGRLTGWCRSIYNSLLTVAADIEATLDFDEDDIPLSALENAPARAAEACDHLKRLLATWEEGHLLREGARVVISGQPNVGKSTLLNHLLGRERAIVAEEPGTTRDFIEETFVLRGIPLRLFDTAGLRDSPSVVETEGVHRARALMAEADLNIHIIDASLPSNEDNVAVVESLPPNRSLLLLNKNDLGTALDTALLPDLPTIPCSLKTGEGTDMIAPAIAAALHIHNLPPPHAVISERHRDIILYVLNELNLSIGALSPDPIAGAASAATHLRSALQRLGEITGQVYTEELIDTVFNRFCVGK
jgi:tRNA modification GTPase